MSSLENQPKTSASLLGRLRADPGDEHSWSLFVERYGKLILKWCCRWGLKLQDAEEVTQNVLVKLSRQMQEFRYDPDGSFRGWLKTIAYRTWCDFLTDQNRRRQCRLSDEVIAKLQTDDVAKSFLDEIERQSRNEEMENAMKVVRMRVEPHTWQAFEMTAIHNMPVEQVASALGIKVPTVYVAKSKVIRMIRNIVEPRGNGSDRSLDANSR